MSIEKSFERIGDALERIADALEAGGTAAPAAAKTEKTVKKAPAASKEKPAKTTAKKATAGKKAPSAKVFETAMTEFIKEPGVTVNDDATKVIDKSLLLKRKEQVLGIAEHFGVGGVREIAADDRLEAMSMLEDLMNSDSEVEEEDEAEDDDEDVL